MEDVCVAPGVQEDRCPAGTLADEEGQCLPAGTPRGRCAEGFLHDGIACEAILPPGPCPFGRMAVPGDPASLSIVTESSRQRLVVLSLFFMKTTEVSVAEFRAASLAEAGDPGVFSGEPDGDAFRDWCTFTWLEGPNDDFPVNCVSWERARAYCQSLGGDLPTEAQLEYVAGGTRSALYVWGMDDPRCGDAVFGLGELVHELDAPGQGAAETCPLHEGIGGPLPVSRSDYGATFCGSTAA